MRGPQLPIGPGGREIVLPTIVAILLGVFWLGVLVTVGFTLWRLVANLKALLRSVTELSERLVPTMEELAERSQEAADLAARLERRQLWRDGDGAPSPRRWRR